MEMLASLFNYFEDYHTMLNYCADIAYKI